MDEHRHVQTVWMIEQPAHAYPMAAYRAPEDFDIQEADDEDDG